MTHLKRKALAAVCAGAILTGLTTGCSNPSFSILQQYLRTSWEFQHSRVFRY